MAIRLEPLSTGEFARWDSLISEFPQRRVFHRQAWFDCMVEIHQAEWKYWAVTDGGRTVGYFSGGIVKRGPFRILGSPLRSWHTNHLGPLLEEGVDGRGFVRALDDLAREEQLSVIEIEYPAMPHAAYEAAGFSCHQTWTHQLTLSTDPTAMMQRMSPGRKHGIQRALRNGLEVVECKDAVYRLHDQLSRGLHSEGTVCPVSEVFPKERGAVPRHWMTQRVICSIVRHLEPLGLVFTLGVRLPTGEVVAAGLFPFDNGTVCLWDCSSELKGREMHANDLLHWGLMCRAAERGMTNYDMSGHGRFNRAFGAQLTAVHRWNKCYSGTARCARDIYEKLLKIDRLESVLSRLHSPVL